MKVVHVLVKLEVTDEVNRSEALQYVRDAVRSWKGALPPEEPLFNVKATAKLYKEQKQ